MKTLTRLLLTICLLALSSTLLHATDSAQEFSIAKNPNGLWSYGSTTTLGGPFTLYPQALINLQGVQGKDFWNVGNTDCTDSQTPIAGRSPEQQTQPPAFIIFPVDTMDMHPGCHGEDSVVRFTAPLSGNYRLRGSFEGIDECCPTTDVHIRLNSATSLLDGDINGFGQVVLFDLQRQVNSGDTIDFIVGFGTDGNYFNDSTALQLTIHLLPAINIKPRDDTNKIHILPPGNVAVAILSSASFNAPAMVVKNSLTFGRIGDEQSLVLRPDRFDSRLLVPVCSTPDVNGDGLKDLVCQFSKQPAGFQLTDTSGVLRGKTGTGVTIRGTDSVAIVK
jgi:hypothetical protein